MLPVFIWRARKELFEETQRLDPTGLEDACVLGFFLELTARLAGVRMAPGVLTRLRRRAAQVKNPFVLFRQMDVSLLRDFAASRTSPLAKSWKLVLGEPDESFENYFKQATAHAAL